MKNNSDGTGKSGLRSFEGAEGYGTTTPGGRGGEIVKVTNLDDSGQGSLRWALEDLDMPRIVVFEVGGRIHLREQIKVNGDVTVAGQTAPGDGITVSGARLRVIEDDVIIRGLKLRPGVTDADNKQARDAISIGNSSDPVEGVVIDSNSLSWATDETAVVWYGSSDITFSNNIIAEGLENDGQPSFGMLIGAGSQRVTVADNLFANNEHRNPQISDVRNIEFVNNVVSNYGDNGFEAPRSEHGATAHVIGNHFIAGSETSTSNPVRLLNASSETEYYLEDNLGSSRPHDGLPENAIAEGAGLANVKFGPIFATSGVTASASEDVLAKVLGSAGARAQGLDKTDARIVDEVENGGGRVISDPSQVGGYDARRVLDAPSDRDDDGIPDIYEHEIGSDPNRFDAHSDLDRDGYSNIENYINGLIDGFGATPQPTGVNVPVTEPLANTPVMPADMRVEADEFDWRSNFVEDSNLHASDDRLIRADRDGESRTGTKFDGPDGVYDLRVALFDETDGESRLRLVVEDETVADWTLDRDQGNSYAHPDTLTSRTAQDVRLEQGDDIVLVGRADGGEPLRIDAVDFLFEYF